MGVEHPFLAVASALAEALKPAADPSPAPDSASVPPAPPAGTNVHPFAAAINAFTQASAAEKDPISAAIQAFMGSLQQPPQAPASANEGVAASGASAGENVSNEEQQLIDAVLRDSMEDFVAVPSQEEETPAVAGGGGKVERPPSFVTTPAPAVSASSAAVREEYKGEHKEEPKPTPAAPQPAAADTALAVWSGLWAKELEVLNAMGFNNTAVLIPLLPQFMHAPCSSSGEATPDVEKMQRLVLRLLSN